MSIPVQWDTAEAKPLPHHLCTEHILWEALFTNYENEAHRKTTDTSQPIFLLEKQLADTPCCYQVLPSQLKHLATDRSQWNIDYNRIFATKTRPVEFVIKLLKSAMNLLQRQSSVKPGVKCLAHGHNDDVTFWFLQFWNLPTITSKL